MPSRLPKSRERASLARHLLADHLDPIEALVPPDAGKAEAAKQVKFKEAAEKYIAAHRAGWKSEMHAKQWATTVETFTPSRDRRLVRCGDRNRTRP